MRERTVGRYSWNNIIYNGDINERKDCVVISFNYHGSCSEDFAKRLKTSIKNYLTNGRASVDEINSILREVPRQGNRFAIQSGFERDLDAIYNEAVYDSVAVQILSPSFDDFYGDRIIGIYLYNAEVLSPESHIKEAKDNKYIAKVGSFYMNFDGSMKDDRDECDRFESETEPRQIFNQLQKDGKLSKNAELKIEKYQENVENIFDKIIEAKTVSVRFSNHKDADEFKDELKDEFNIPRDVPRYRVVGGKTRTGNTVFVESFNIGDIYRNENGAEIRVYDVDEDTVSYRMTHPNHVHTDSYCTDKDSLKNCIRINGYIKESLNESFKGDRAKYILQNDVKIIAAWKKEYGYKGRALYLIMPGKKPEYLGFPKKVNDQYALGHIFTRQEGNKILDLSSRLKPKLANEIIASCGLRKRSEITNGKYPKDYFEKYFDSFKIETVSIKIRSPFTKKDKEGWISYLNNLLEDAKDYVEKHGDETVSSCCKMSYRKYFTETEDITNKMIYDAVIPLINNYLNGGDFHKDYYDILDKINSDIMYGFKSWGYGRYSDGKSYRWLGLAIREVLFAIYEKVPFSPELADDVASFDASDYAGPYD